MLLCSCTISFAGCRTTPQATPIPRQSGMCPSGPEGSLLDIVHLVVRVYQTLVARHMHITTQVGCVPVNTTHQLEIFVLPQLLHQLHANGWFKLFFAIECNLPTSSLIQG